MQTSSEFFRISTVSFARRCRCTVMSVDGVPPINVCRKYAEPIANEYENNEIQNVYCLPKRRFRRKFSDAFLNRFVPESDTCARFFYRFIDAECKNSEQSDVSQQHPNLCRSRIMKTFTIKPIVRAVKQSPAIGHTR